MPGPDEIDILDLDYLPTNAAVAYCERLGGRSLRGGAQKAEVATTATGG